MVNELLFTQSLKEDEITESNKAILTTSIIEQAKQIEKEQIEKSFENGQKIILDVFKKYSESLSNCAKAYYREAYGKE